LFQIFANIFQVRFYSTENGARSVFAVVPFLQVAWSAKTWPLGIPLNVRQLPKLGCQETAEKEN
jgi:hypothetical protein